MEGMLLLPALPALKEQCFSNFYFAPLHSYAHANGECWRSGSYWLKIWGHRTQKFNAILLRSGCYNHQSAWWLLTLWQAYGKNKWLDVCRQELRLASGCQEFLLFPLLQHLCPVVPLQHPKHLIRVLLWTKITVQHRDPRPHQLTGISGKNYSKFCLSSTAHGWLIIAFQMFGLVLIVGKVISVRSTTGDIIPCAAYGLMLLELKPTSQEVMGGSVA